MLLPIYVSNIKKAKLQLVTIPDQLLFHPMTQMIHPHPVQVIS